MSHVFLSMTSRCQPLQSPNVCAYFSYSDYDFDELVTSPSRRIIYSTSEHHSQYKDSIKMCTKFNRFFSGHTFWNQCKTCVGASAVIADPQGMFKQVVNNEDFTKDILQRFRNRYAAKVCLSDAIIQQVGHRR